MAHDLIDYPAHGSSRGRLYVPPFVVTEPPELPLLTLEEARRHLKQDAWMGGNPAAPTAMGHPDDPDIADLVAAATGELEAPNGWLGRAIMPQTIEVRLDRLEAFHVPCPPTIEVVSVNAEQPGGGWQFIDAETYRLTDDAPYSVFSREPGAVWPTGRAIVTFRAGYEPPAEGQPVSRELALIRSWARLRLHDLYSNPGTQTKMNAAPFAAHLLTNLRVRT